MSPKTTTRRRRNNSNGNAPVLQGESPTVQSKGETGLTGESPEDSTETPTEDALESTEGEAADLSDATGDDESDDASDDESEASGEPTEDTESAAPEAEKKKQKRTLTVFEVQSNYGIGGVEAIKAFAEKEKRAITVAPIEKALNALQLMFDDAEAYKKKCTPLIEYLSFLKAQPGTGKGKRATYTIGGPPSPFTVQRPFNKQTKRKGKPLTVVPLKCLKLKENVDNVWIRFTDDEIVIRRDKNFKD